MQEHDFLSTMNNELLALFLTPVGIIAIFAAVEQRFERIHYSRRYVKTAWDLHIFSVGTQLGLFIDHPFKGGLNGSLYELCFLFTVLGSMGLLARLRYRIQRSQVFYPQRIPTDNEVFQALWLGCASVCVPAEYLVLSTL